MMMPRIEKQNPPGFWQNCVQHFGSFLIVKQCFATEIRVPLWIQVYEQSVPTLVLTWDIRMNRAFEPVRLSVYEHISDRE